MDVLAELRALAAPHGIEVVDRGGGHVQLRGRLVVNYYPTSKKRTAYVERTEHGRAHVTPREAILMALTVTEAPNGKPRRQSQARVKKRLLARTPRVGVQFRCWYCQRLFLPEDLTVEHLVPLSKGGPDTDDNKVLACEPCNRARGNRMPEIPAPLAGKPSRVALNPAAAWPFPKEQSK